MINLERQPFMFSLCANWQTASSGGVLLPRAEWAVLQTRRYREHLQRPVAVRLDAVLVPRGQRAVARLGDLKIESSKTIELDRFVSRDEVDPLYLDTPYYVYPDRQIAGETFLVIGEAMTRADKVGLGRIVLANRERQVLSEPRSAGLVMSTLRASDEVRAADFEDKGGEGEVDPELVALAATIIERKAGAFDPSNFHDHYQEALRELVQSKRKGEVAAAPEEVEEPPKVINLMEALKRSLAREEAGSSRAPAAAASSSAAGSSEAPARRHTRGRPPPGRTPAPGRRRTRPPTRSRGRIRCRESRSREGGGRDRRPRSRSPSRPILQRRVPQP